MRDSRIARALSSRAGDFLAAAAGAILPLAFAPFEFWPVVFLSLGLLFATFAHAAPKRAAFRGFLYGLTSFGIGTSWVYHSLHSFGGMPSLMAIIAVGLFVALLACFPALAAWASVKLAAPVPLWITLPAAWALAEWLRAQSLWAFSWLSVGYSQADSPLAGFAPVFGIYGVSFATAFIAACIVVPLVLPARALARWIPLPLAVCFVGAGFMLQGHQWSAADGETLDVALVQANIDINTKWEAGSRETIRGRYLELSDAARDADLVVWPESAMPTVLASLEEGFFQTLKQHPADFVFGVIEARRGPVAGQAVYYNSAAVVDDAAKDDAVLWRKSHLVPFGEYLPLRAVFGVVLDFLSIPMSDFRPYAGEQGAIDVAGTRIGISICFEDAFPRDMFPTVPDARVLVHISEDAWFGDSFGPPQRFEMGRMRAIEFARPMVRASNTGMTGIIDSKGRVLGEAPQFTTHVQLGTVQPRSGATPFVRWKHWPVLGMSVALLAFAAARRRAGQHSSV